MVVTMVQIGVVRMGVPQTLMMMRVDMRFARLIICRMPVLMVVIVDMGMDVVHGLVNVLVTMPLDQM